ncbi:MAG: DNA primase DnaG [Candidatus Nanohaloarchaea archaeon]
MGKAAMKQANYVIVAEVKTSGLVEKSDIVGAIFGQTEGLLGDLELKQLRKKGKVSRLEIDLEENGEKAELKIPTSMNATDTSLFAASLETIEQIGPSNADIRVKEIRDERASKRDYIVKRAKQLLNEIKKDSPDRKAIEEDLKKEIRSEAVTEYRGFPAGPDADLSDEIILVEGESDVKNLLRCGVKNAVALGGSSVPEEIEKMAEEKDVTAFVDGDRGGKLILKELKQKEVPRYFAKAPEDEEVEEISEKKIHELLRDKKPVKYAEVEEVDDERPEFEEEFRELVGTRAAMSLDEEGNELERVPASNIGELSEEAYAVVVDGEIDEAAVEKAEELEADYIAGKTRGGSVNSSKVRILTRKERVEA